MGVHDGHREKMRSRLLNHGAQSLADHEILGRVPKSVEMSE